MSEWQKIETAPKDGSVFDVINKYGDRTTDVHYDEKRGGFIHWWINDYGDVGWTIIKIPPTHWMPLPTPPA